MRAQNWLQVITTSPNLSIHINLGIENFIVQLLIEDKIKTVITEITDSYEFGSGKT